MKQKEFGNKLNQISVMENMIKTVQIWYGNNSFKRKNYDKAIDYYSLYLDLNKEVEFELGNNYAKYFIGIAYFYKNDFKESRKYFEELTGLIDNDFNTQYLGDDSINLGALALSWVLIMDAKNNLIYKNDLINIERIVNDKSYRWEIQHFLQGNSKDTYIQINYNLYKIYQILDDSKKAKKYLQNSYNRINQTIEKYTNIEAKNSFINKNLLHKIITEEYNDNYKKKF